VSVADRLKYEQPRRPLPTLNHDRAEVNQNIENSLPMASIADEIARLEEKIEHPDEAGWKRYARKYALKSLNSIHDRVVAEFTFAQGFGVTRARQMPVRQDIIEIPELKSVTLPEIPESSSGESSSEDAGD